MKLALRVAFHSFLIVITGGIWGAILIVRHLVK